VTAVAEELSATKNLKTLPIDNTGGRGQHHFILIALRQHHEEQLFSH
jgi:hypothetical protein